MFNKFTLSVAILAASFSISQAADDIQAPIDSARFDWSGAYAGVMISKNWVDDDWTDPALAPGSLFGTVDADGISAGVLVGHNWQNNDWVYGFEADAELGSFGGWQQNPAVFWYGFADMNWQASLRGRLGRVVNGYHLYGTAGIAVANFDLDYNGFPVHVGDRYTDTLVGWTAGAGAEKKFQNGLIGRLEYRYSDFGRSEGPIINCCALLPFRQRHDITESKVSFALVKKLTHSSSSVHGYKAEDAQSDWSGAYAGLFAGYNNTDLGWSLPLGGPGSTFNGSIEQWSGGAFVGFNAQNGNAVYGIEADIEGFSGDDTFVGVPGPGILNASLEQAASLRARVGRDQGQYLPYLFAGIALAQLDTTGIGTNVSDTHWGYTMGAGVDAKVGENGFVRLEYGFSDYSEARYQYCPICIADISLDRHAVRIGAGMLF